MPNGDEKKPAGKKRRFIRKRPIAGDLLKAGILALVIFLAGWGITARGERLRQAEVLVNIAEAGIQNPEELKSIKWLIDKGDIQEAIMLLRDIVRGDDENFVAHYFLGVAYAKRGLASEALAEFKRVLELGGWEDKTYYNMGVIYESMGFFDQAYAAYEAAHRANPEDRNYIRARDKVDYVIEADLGFDVQYQLRFNEASAALIQVPPDLEFASNTFEYLVARFPHKVEPLHLLGVVRSKQGRLIEAEEIFLGAIEMEPGFALSYYNLGILYQALGRWSEAKDSFMKCLNLTPDEKNREVVSSHIRQVEDRIASLN